MVAIGGPKALKHQLRPVRYIIFWR